MDLAITICSKKLGSTACTIKVQNLEATLPTILIVTFFICRCWSTTTRKGRVYKNDTRCMRCMRKYETDGRYPSQYGFYNGARSRQVAGDLSSWRRECRGACI